LSIGPVCVTGDALIPMRSYWIKLIVSRWGEFSLRSTTGLVCGQRPGRLTRQRS